MYKGWLDKQMKAKLEENGIKVKMYKRYVEDINIIVSVDPAMNEDIDGDEGRVMERVKSIGNGIVSKYGLKTAIGYCMNTPNQFRPSL